LQIIYILFRVYLPHAIAVFRHVDTAFDHGFAACEDPSSIFVREREIEVKFHPNRPSYIFVLLFYTTLIGASYLMAFATMY